MRWIVLILVMIPVVPVWAYSGGTGEPNDPYQIATAEDLIALGNEPNDYNDCFVLTADIDLSGYVFDRAVIAPDVDSDYPFNGTEFTGSFDGQGHVISHLTIQGAYYLGLFGYCDSGAIISNLGLEAIDVNGTGDYVGVLVGYSGGIITLSYSIGSVAGDDKVGGLVGFNDYGAITSSYSTSSVLGDWYVGGLVGWNSGSVTSCYSTGSVSGFRYPFWGSRSRCVGGLVGFNGGSIMSSYSTGVVYGGQQGDVGGLLGSDILPNASGQRVGSVTSSFWNLETSGQSESAGGTGLTTAEMQDPNTFLGASWDLVDEIAHGTSDFWIVQEGDYPSLAVFAGLLSIEPNGTGIADDPYLLTDGHELGTVWARPGACYRMEADIDLSGVDWNNAVVPGFGGRFDGNDHVISDLRIKGAGHLGLFGICVSGAVISHLGLERVDVKGIDNFVGGLVGRNYYSTITSSYSNGSVSGGDYYVGGLVGYNYYSTITSSYSNGSVSGLDMWVGGLVGYNYRSTITLSYSTGTVSGNDNVGGLVGGSYYGSSISSSYSTGTVSGNDNVGGLLGSLKGSYSAPARIITSYSTGLVSGDGDIGGLVGSGWSSDGAISSFWDIETSGQTDSDGGAGLTTLEMQNINTFLDAGWDFINETANGTVDTWMMPVEVGYPQLTIFNKGSEGEF